MTSEISSNQIVSEIVDFQVPDTTNSTNTAVPSTTLHKMYVDLMKNYKELKQENEDLLKKNEVLNLINEELKRTNDELKLSRDGEAVLAQQVFRLKDDNKALNKKMEQLKNKHDAEMQNMRIDSKRNAYIASKRSDEIKKLKKENEDMEVVINDLVGDKKDLQKKYDDLLRGEGVHAARLAYNLDHEGIDEIERLKLENKHVRERNAELNDDRNILRGVVNDLCSVISCQHE